MVPGVKKKRRRRHRRSRGEEESQRFLSSDSDSDAEQWAYDGKKSTRCGKLEKELGILLGVSLLIILTLAVVILVQAISRPADDETCSSPDCVAVAGSMISLMNLSAQPCDDFYEYACGNWANKHIPPPNQPKYGVFGLIDDRNVAHLRKILEEPPDLYKGQNSSALYKAHLYYKACMDEEATQKRGARPLLQLIKILGSWGVTSDSESGTWNKDTWNFTKTLIDTNNLGLTMFFAVGMSEDDKNSTANILQFSQGGLSLSDRDQYIGNHSNKYHEAYVRYFVRLSTLLGAQPDSGKKAAEEIWNFEKQLAEWYLSRAELADTSKLYHQKTLAEVQELLGSKFEVLKLMQGLFNQRLTADEKVVVYTPDYLKKVGDFVKKTDDRILANYMVWHAVQEMAPYCSREFKEAVLILKKVTKGISSISPTWERCVARTSSVLRFATGAVYIQDHFSKEEKEEVISILHKVRQALVENFPSVSWMDQLTRDRAVDKANAMQEAIGYPAFIEDPAQLDHFYENLKGLTGDNEFNNAVAISRFYVWRNLRKRGLPVDKNEWHMGPAEVNAYYNAGYNIIVFPAGVLQWPIYDARAPMSVKYGAVGMVMGHEMTHGFDNEGRLYNKDGNLENWWGNTSVDAFKKKSKCMADQYSHYKVGSGHLNGQQTLPENIADNGGLKMAHRAFQNWLHTQVVKDTLLPGLNLTADQQFFLGFAQVWCSYYTPQYALHSLMADTHSYAKYRVIGTLSNMESFSKAYGCPAKSRMNPEKKCVIW